MTIKLNFINQSNDRNNSEIVFFQKNVATDFDELAVAWKTIKFCGQGDNHPFNFPMTMEISASDSYGNFTPKMKADNGEMFHVTLDGSGNVLASDGAGTSAKEVQCRNDLSSGSINAGIYKDGKLLARKTSIAPSQKAVFEFKPTLWVGVVSQVEEGQVMNSAIMSDVNTELSLLGIDSADIVLSGGGPGKNSSAFKFTLENIVMA
ncbi:MAG: hypothetical protein HRT53_01850 [Colwellia sp.]|nr:hypothetical protein [Colwellia sp.]